MAYKKKSGRGGSQPTKEVASKHAPFGTIEESFGPKPPKIAVGGGDMCTFGFKPNSAIWNDNIVSASVKTGFPKGFDQPKKGPTP